MGVVQVVDPAVTVKVLTPTVVGVPVPFRTMDCTPVVVKVPDPEKLMPPTVLVVTVQLPTVVTFTCTVSLLAEVRAVFCV